MKVWIVFVYVRAAKKLLFRYIDSQWAREKAASDRKTELEQSFAAFGCFSTRLHGSDLRRKRCRYRDFKRGSKINSDGSESKQYG